LALKANAFNVITRITGHYSVQGHSRSPILVGLPIESPYVCDFLSVNNSNLHRILHRFQVIADNWSRFRCRKGFFDTVFRGEPLNLGLRRFTSRN